MKMRKIVSVLLATAVTVGMLAGCGSGNGSSDSSSANTPSG